MNNKIQSKEITTQWDNVSVIVNTYKNGVIDYYLVDNNSGADKYLDHYPSEDEIKQFSIDCK